MTGYDHLGPDVPQEVKGDGLGPESEEDLVLFKQELQQIDQDAAWGTYERRWDGNDTRFCRWSGQAADGRKHREEMDGIEPFPFEGASDSRYRLADMIVNENVMILTAAATRVVPHFKGMEISDEGLGRKMEILFRWLIRNQMGSQYITEVMRLAQYQQGDTPAAGLLYVYWKQESALEIKSISMETLPALLEETFQASPEDIASILGMINDPLREDEAVVFLQAMVPTMKRKRAKKVIKALRKNEEAGFPVPYYRVNLPCIRALRLFDDIHFPSNTIDLQRSRVVFYNEWLTEAEVREREVSMGWSAEFIKGVLEHEGETAFPLSFQWREAIAGDYADTVTIRTPSEERRGLYQVIHAFNKAVNEDGVMGIFVRTFHMSVEEPAKEREILDYAHGKYPFVYFPREVITSRLWDSRGVPELTMTQQTSLKLKHDSFDDYTQLATVPPIKVPANRPRERLVIGPLKQVKENRRGDVEYMKGPDYPKGAIEQQKEVRRQVDEYFGRYNPEVDPQLWTLHKQHMVDMFLSFYKDAMVMMLQLCQQFMSDEQVERVIGTSTPYTARSRQEIQGQFDLELTFDVRDMDMEYLKTLASMLHEMVLPMDTQSTVMRDKLVSRMFYAISPNLAEETLQPVEAANMKEAESEQSNFAKIYAGVEPPMLPEGQNYGLRLQVLQDIIDKNPESVNSMNEASRSILEARIKHLQFMVTQQENAEIGRVGAKPALEE